MANYRKRLRNCRETCDAGSMIAFVKCLSLSMWQANGRAKQSLDVGRSVRRGYMVALRAVPYRRAARHAPSAFSLECWLLINTCTTSPLPRMSAAPHHRSCTGKVPNNGACKLRPSFWHDSVCSNPSCRMTHFNSIMGAIKVESLGDVLEYLGSSTTLLIQASGFAFIAN